MLDPRVRFLALVLAALHASTASQAGVCCCCVAHTVNWCVLLLRCRHLVRVCVPALCVVNSRGEALVVDASAYDSSIGRIVTEISTAFPAERCRSLGVRDTEPYDSFNDDDVRKDDDDGFDDDDDGAAYNPNLVGSVEQQRSRGPHAP
jgi:hypothetical protein